MIGREQALFLIGQLPQSGSRAWRVCLYVPKRIKAGHQLVRWLGWRDATKLVDAFGGMILQPSNCNYIVRQHRNRSILAMAEQGMTPQEIAEAVSLSVKQVTRVMRSGDNPPEAARAANDNNAPKLAAGIGGGTST